MGMLVVSLWGVNYRFSDEHPRYFYMRVSPGIKYALISLSYGPHFLCPGRLVIDMEKKLLGS